ncbi:MAG: amino acid adenylation domain-containing protein [Isosphaeraceae bacterium]
MDRLPEYQGRIVVLDDDVEIAHEPEWNPFVEVSGENLAYIIYTSGSTGRPKGAMIAHRGLSNYLAYAAKTYAVRSGCGAPVHSSISFDLTVTSVLAPLIVGGRVDLLPEGPGVEELADSLRQGSDYSLVKLTPAHLELLGQSLRPHEAAGGTRLFVIGGEQLTGEQVAYWLENAPGTGLINEYGPTETVVGCCVYRVPAGTKPTGAIPIGKPIANMRLYVLDRGFQPVPVGVSGELYIGGVGVARGYLNRPDLTAERFVPDPYSGKPGARLYKTGDLARWRVDGNLEYLGRIDDQVKVRGYRIELGEIEAALGQHPAVRQAAVLARPDAAGETQLVAYTAFDSDLGAPTISALRNFLKGSLPEFMVPSAFVLLDALPLTINGKVDRAALPAPTGGRAALETEFQSPRTPTESIMAGIWASVLGIEQVGVFDNFFELGGHSLLATQVVSRLRDAYGVDVPLRALFEAPTVAALTERVEAAQQRGQNTNAGVIQPIPGDEPPPLSFAQQALWYLDQLAPGQATFNVSAAARVAGPLDLDALERGLNELIRRHESLRTTFALSEGRPVQVVARELTLTLQPDDLSTLPTHRREAEAERLAIEESRRPFDLARGPLVRARLLKLADRDHAVILTMHHVITDGWSFGVATGELAALYAAFRQGQPSPLAPLPIRYADFAHWQRAWLQGDVLDELLSYWRGQLSNVPALELPTDRPRPAVRTARGALRTFTLSANLSEGLRALSRREGATPFMTLLAAFQVLLHRYSGQEDFAVGSPIANRNRAETEGLIGYFVNMLALRADLSGDPTFQEFLARVREVALGAYEHQDLPLELLIEALQPRRDPSRTPLFQAMFVLQNNQTPDVGRQDLVLDALGAEGTGTAKFELSLGIADSPDGFTGSLEYNTDLFDAETIDRMLEHFQTLLDDLVAHPDHHVSELALLTDPERNQVLNEWGSTPSKGAASPRCIHELFESQVRKNPDALALVAGAERLTYSDLNRRANQIAHHLRTLGIGPESRVGLVAANPPHVLAGLLGVLKAGAAYVPMDPTAPKERLRSSLADADLALLLTEASLQAQLPEHNAAVVLLDGELSPFGSRSTRNPSKLAKPDNLAYIIYTSGSTGTPKGVTVSHASLFNAFQGWETAYKLRKETTSHLQMASVGFDVFTGDWVRALGSGSTLVACPKDVLLDPEALDALMRREGVDSAEFVPAVAETLVPYLEQTGRSLDALRLLVVGSDLWHAGQYERLRRLGGPSTRIVNSYGVTEATIDSTYFEGDLSDQPPGRPVPIGRPFARTQVYVLDRKFHPVPAGVPGELCIGGLGLARGYHRNPSLTAERFIPDPFGGEPGARLYRTGDLARWRLDGQLELLGRIDHQVKIRGFRIELGEIESTLRRHPNVRDVVVNARDDGNGGKALTAYVVPLDVETITAEELRRYLKDRLPRAMIPSAFVPLAAFPLNSSGKVDRQGLPAPEPADAGRSGEVLGPRDEVETQLIAIWEDVLNVRPIGVRDDFFDLGGHSLMAVRLTARIEEQFGRKVALSTFLLGVTIEDLAATLQKPADQGPWTPLVHLGVDGPGQPLFLAHPIGGNVLCYKDLARRFDGVRPVFGLQAAGIDGEAEPESNLETIAASYVAVIRAQQPVGPYLLGGWSLGGVVAFEMARQLRAQGQGVAPLILIDSQPPGARAGSIDDRSLMTAFAIDLARGTGMVDLPPLDRLRALKLRSVEAGISWLSAFAPDLGAERLRSLFEVFRANSLALSRYAPRLNPAPLILLRSAGRNGRDPSLGWSHLASKGVIVHEFPGDHYTMIQAPAVDRVAELIESEIANFKRQE